MSDIFLSYARPDRIFAGELAYALGRAGWNIWWDSELLPGRQFAREIQQHLYEARCVVALWSRHSIESSWVRDEARHALERGVLIPVIVDEVSPPLGFGQTQSADLRGWDGTVSHAGFAALSRAVQHLAGAPERRRRALVQRKICLLGPAAVGKTSLVRRFVKSIFTDKYLSTVGVKVDNKHVEVGNTRVTLLVWDVEGLDELRDLIPSYWRGMSGYLLVVDGTRLQTLSSALALEETVRASSVEPVPFTVVLNKANLIGQWAIGAEHLKPLQLRGWDLRRASALSGEGVEDAFRWLAARVMDETVQYVDVRPFDREFAAEGENSEHQLLRAALVRNGSNFLAWARLAGSFERRNESGLAARAVARAERETPNTSQAHLVLAEELARGNRVFDAVKHLELALALDAASVPDAHRVLAPLYLRLGSTAKAAAQYRLFLATNPPADLRAEVERRLRDLGEASA